MIYELDADTQITLEEVIAGKIFDKADEREEDNPPADWPNEQECGDLGRNILRYVLSEVSKFTPTTTNGEADAYEKLDRISQLVQEPVSDGMDAIDILETIKYVVEK